MNAAPIYCANCGRPIPAGANFCESCGAPVAPAPPPQPYPQTPAVQMTGAQVPPPPPPNYPAQQAPPPGWTPAPASAYPPPGFYRPLPNRRSGGGAGWLTCFLVGCLVLVLLVCCVLVIGVIYYQRSGGMMPWLQRYLGSQVDPMATQIFEALETQGIDPSQGIEPLITQGIEIPLPTFEGLPTLDIIPLMTEIPPNFGSTYFSDDFSSQDKGWKIETTSDYSVQYENEQLAIKVLREGASASVRPPVDFQPTTLEFSVQIAPENQNGTLGSYEVMCDYQDADNYHTIAIDPDTNSYTFALVKDGVPQILTSPEWKSLSADVPSLRDNPAKILVECAGGTMTLSVNDVFQDQASESTFTSGEMWIGVRLWEGSPYPNGFKILIDDLTIFKPMQ